jgi:hypothetical protein
MKHEEQTITYIVEHIVLVDAAAPNPYHVLISVLYQL